MSKFLQFLSVPEMAAKSADLGFRASISCVRAGAHVLPERVEEELPRVADVIRKAGRSSDDHGLDRGRVHSWHTEKILRTAAALGIRNYRWGGFSYDRGRGIPEQIESLKPRVRELSDMNKYYKMCAMYHIHSGLVSVWCIRVGSLAAAAPTSTRSVSA